jgi:hypothetical protein
VPGLFGSILAKLLSTKEQYQNMACVAKTPIARESLLKRQEEADLKVYMDNLQLFAEPSAARFVREVTGQI